MDHKIQVNIPVVLLPQMTYSGLISNTIYQIKLHSIERARKVTPTYRTGAASAVSTVMPSFLKRSLCRPYELPKN